MRVQLRIYTTRDTEDSVKIALALALRGMSFERIFKQQE